MLMTLDVIFQTGAMMLINGPRNQKLSFLLSSTFEALHWSIIKLLRLFFYGLRNGLDGLPFYYLHADA
jgi:hypothetical protein